MKNRDSIYLAVRLNSDGRYSVCSAHPDWLMADRVVAANTQTFKDRGWDDIAKFEVWTTTYYDDE